MTTTCRDAEKGVREAADELFNEIKPMTVPKQEWRRKEAPQCSTTEPAADGQTVTPGSQTATDSVPGSQTAPSGSQTT
jgi:hypothetical protein